MVKVLKISLFLCLLYFSYLLILICLQYIPINYEIAFLKIKVDEIKLLHYKIVFFTHVYSSVIVLLTAIIQISKIVRIKWVKLHKLSGKIYVITLLAFACPSGLVMAYYANGGVYSKLSFVILGLLWFMFTYLGFKYIKQGKIQQHQKMMYRSFALTLSAISLRLFKWAIVSVFNTAPMDTYKIVAWAGWVINLIIVEIFIYFYFKKNKSYV